MHAASDGKDLEAEKEEKRNQPTFRYVATEYLEKHAKVKKRKWKEDERLIHKELLPHWDRRKADKITRRDVIEVLDGIANRGAPIQANRVLSLISKIFNWAIGRDLVENNPARLVAKPGKESRRERVLSEEEIRLVWDAFKLQSPVTGTMLMLRLLTAQRGGEIESMAWKDLDLENGWWTIPGEIAKNGLAHRVPLTPMALKMLSQLQPISGTGRWVFPSPTVKGQHITNVQKAAIRVKQLSGVEDFVLHDLRRTAASYMASGGVNRLVLGKVLNHVDSSVTAVYDRHGYDAEKRNALERWNGRLMEIIGADDKQHPEEPTVA